MSELEARRARRRAVVAGIAGNLMEWYDFAIYGYFVRTIGALYFPSDDPKSAMLAAYGAFAVGFIMRPLGAVLFGHIGDRIGRGPAMLWSVIAMAVPTFLIGLLPTHAQIGNWAAVAMVVCRAVQGLSVGGEYTGSAVFLAESARANRRAFASAWAPFGAVAGMVLGSAVGALVLNALPLEQVVAWGWRAAFLLGGVLGCVGFLLRRRMAHDRPAAAPAAFPLAVALRQYPRQLMQVVGIALANAAGFYIVFFYIIPWLKNAADIGARQALVINSANMATMLLVIPIAATMADRHGRKPVLTFATVGLLLLSLPLMALMQSGGPWAAYLGQLGFALLIGSYAGVMPVVICEMFPHGVRCSAASTAYNVTLGIAGGTAPTVAEWLIERTGQPLSPAFYLTGLALVSLLAVAWMSESASRPLDMAAAPQPAE
jgi:MHS family proline/betaine transporter-like MFS transporter